MDLIKQAALFNDCVLPFPFEVFDNQNDIRFDHIREKIYECISPSIYKQLTYPISLLMNRKYQRELSEEFNNIPYLFSSLMKIDFVEKERLLLELYKNNGIVDNFTNIKVKETIYGDNDEIISCKVTSRIEQMKEFGFAVNYVMPSNKLSDPNATMEDISVILSGIELIDTKKASWEQIIDYRQNENAKKKLRNLRLFLQTSYTGKSRQYIEDDFGKRIDDYNSVVKEYGFNKKKSVISFLANSKNIQTFGTASIASIMLGQPIIATGSALTGICLEILNATLEFATQKHSFNKFKEQHELSYIMDFYDQI